MSDELFEVAFCGETAEGANIDQVKAKVGAMFKADANKLAHLFSGKRVVIKKNIDEATANKYKTALMNAGALCEVKSLTASPVTAPAPAAEPSSAAAPPAETPAPVEKAAVSSRQPALDSAGIPAAPDTDPLGISANDISDLGVDIAPVGSMMQDDIQQVEEPDVDISELDMAPAGSDLGELKKKDAPPPPDTSGMSLLDD